MKFLEAATCQFDGNLDLRLADVRFVLRRCSPAAADSARAAAHRSGDV